MSGSAGLFNKCFFCYLVGSPKVGGTGDGKHTKNTATLTHMLNLQLSILNILRHLMSTFYPIFLINYSKLLLNV